MKLDSYVRIGNLMILAAAALAATVTLVFLVSDPFFGSGTYLLPEVTLATIFSWAGFGTLFWGTLHDRDECKDYVEQQLAAVGYPIHLKRFVGSTLAEIRRHKRHAGWVSYGALTHQAEDTAYWTDLDVAAEALPALDRPLLVFSDEDGELYGALFGLTTDRPGAELEPSANRVRITMVGETQSVPRRFRC